MTLSRRHFLAAAPAALAAQSAPRIDRRAVVSRHNPTLTAIDPRSPLSVGNGEFAFTADVTGLQTFPRLYDNHMPLCTMSQWGWHTIPNPTGQTFRRFPSHRIRHLRPPRGLPDQFHRPEAVIRLAPRKSPPAASGKNRLPDRRPGSDRQHQTDTRPVDRHPAQPVPLSGP